MPRSLSLVLTLLLALPLAAAYSGQDLVLPVVGHSAGGDGRLYDTSLWITNLSLRHGADVTLAFYESGQKNPKPRKIHLRIGAGATWLTEQMDATLAGNAPMGAIRVTSSEEVIATARTYSRMAGDSNARAVASAFAAIPTQFAIGNGETTTMQGILSRDSRYKLYLVEVTGDPLALTASLLHPDGRTISEKPLYVDAHMHLATDVHSLFGDAVPEHALLRVTGMNGEGRVVVAAAQIASESQDSSAYEMTFRTAPRNRMSAGEAVAYSTAALAVLVAAFYRPRRMQGE